MIKQTLKKIRAAHRYRTSSFARFEKSFHKETRPLSREIVAWAQEIKNQPEHTVDSDDPVALRGRELREALARDFKNKYDRSPLRVLIHLPNQHISPAGWSIFANMKEAADYLGYETAFLEWDDDTKAVLENFKPNVFLTSDSDKWLEKVDWKAMADYRASQQLLLGLTASTAEENSLPLETRLAAARERNVSFYYVYDPAEYLEEREEAYAPFRRACPLYTYEYTVNPLRFYPEPGFERDVNYIMLGSGYNNADKRRLYMEWYDRLWRDYPGILYGPGWKGLPFMGMDGDRDRYLYARCKAGLNLSIPRQLKWHASLNERTYILAACGIPQLSDRALLLDKRFTGDEILMADSPEEYYDLFERLIHDDDWGRKLALNAQEKVLGQYTNFHSVEAFFTRLEKQLKETL